MPIKKKYKDNEDITRMLGDAWLNIHFKDESKLFNPLIIPPYMEDNEHIYITWLLSRPEYFSFVCKEILNVTLPPYQALILKELWHRRFPMLIACRGFSKSYMLAIYTMLRILLLPRRRVIMAGAAFRQSKVIFEYMESIWNNAPLLRDIVGGGANGPKHSTDMFKFVINDSYASAIPVGTGEKIRGQRANDIIADEFASISREIFENVMAGFASVRANPIQAMQIIAMEELARKLGIWDEQADEVDEYHKDNQIVISGTAYYEFNHFADYWKRWHKIICSRGDKSKLKEIFKNEEDGEIPKGFDWTAYSIIRIPYELVPRGFMDEAQVTRSRATIHSGIYDMEFGAVFSTDSNGFYKRSTIEKCVASAANIASGTFDYLSEKIEPFEPTLYGRKDRVYVFGIDPASQVDNFSIVIIELHNSHRRIVYSWVTNKEQHKAEIKAGFVQETDFYAYCSKKIRQLMKRFRCERIAMDSQGGGFAVMEALQDKDKMEDGEQPIWPVIDPDKEQDSDTMAGLHIVHLINFADSQWTVEANNELRKDLEDRVLLFPYVDAVNMALASSSDMLSGKIRHTDDGKIINFDTYEDCIQEIEEIKDELASIVQTQTPSGRDRWDTPEIKLPGNKKGRQRKDRYSALLMANKVARTIQRNPEIDTPYAGGGFAARIDPRMISGELYTGNQWFAEGTKNVSDLYGGV